MVAVLNWLFGSAANLSQGYCLDWRPSIVALMAASEAVVALSYLAVPLGFVWFARRRHDLLQQHRLLLWLFSGLILSTGATNLIEIATIWFPIHGFLAVAKALNALTAIATVAVMWPQLPALVRIPTSQQLSDMNRHLRREVASHESTLRELETAHHELESRVEERTRELSLVKARYETALRGAQVYLFSQDRNLAYTWRYSPRGDEIMPEGDSEAVIAVKRKVIESGVADDIETLLKMPEGPVLFALHIDPTFAPDGSVDGLMCAAIDVSRTRSLESERERLTTELATALQRYETALHGSNVTVFTQDRDLRYTSISSAMLGRSVTDIVGRREEEIVPAGSLAPIVALKKEVLESGEPRDGEVRIADNGARPTWLDLHIEPQRDIAGRIVGVTCAAVDITERKQDEAHLRLLMRELTHRSKNLLAVIQAMARRTAQHTGSVEAFLDQFSARLQALARSHDLLVQESWHGASLTELVRSQLGHYLDRATQIKIEGPPVLLRPEAAQSIGLALHELATNAMKYGSLSAPAGTVSISWRNRSPSEGSGVEILWNERGGPPVVPPQRRGFGSLVIERNLARALDARVAMVFAPDGLQCRIEIPAEQLTEAR